MSESISITPFTSPCRGEAKVPGSKSITNRALLLAALSNRKVTLDGALFSDDVEIMVEALTSLGFIVNTDKQTARITVKGESGRIPSQSGDLFVGNAGTVARFLTAALCLRWGGKYRLDGTEAMRERPMQGLIDSLKQLGARFIFEKKDGHFPFVIETQGIKEGTWVVDATASSQILSAMLMVAPLAEETVEVVLKNNTVSKPFVEMTLKMCDHFSGGNAAFNINGNNYKTISNKGYAFSSENYQVEPDATAASYFLALPIATGGSCSLKGFKKDSIQGDVGFIDILDETGMLTDFTNGGAYAEAQSKLEGKHFNFNDISDTFLTFAALAPLLKGNTTISGIAHTRKQETDRVSAMANEIRKLGQEVLEDDDSITITPSLENLRRKALEGVCVDTYHDHRVAMSFGILGSADILGNGQPWLTVRDPMCCAKTFPKFFEELERIRLLSLAPK